MIFVPVASPSTSVSTTFGGVFDVSTIEKKIAEKETETCSPDFWNDREKAEAILNDLTAMKRRVESWNKLFRDYDDILELIRC